MNIVTSLHDQAQELLKQFEKESVEIRQEPSSKRIEELRIRWLGRKGEMNKLYDVLKSVDKAERPQAGKALNHLRGQVDKTVAELKHLAVNFHVEQQLRKPSIDVS